MDFTLHNGITEAEYTRRFPLPYCVRSLTPWEALRAGLSSDRTWFHYLAPFTFLSEKWGPITAPVGMITDFASVPPILRSLFDDDGPWLLYPSSPHDLLFLPREDGRRGYLPSGVQLTLRECNEVLAEAMWYCGAPESVRRDVFLAVEIANREAAHLFAPSTTEARS